ncbi:DUF1289 domain-containing protein [Wenxinia saemankumensis]|uniref:DUF1289 domain-containing protein n=1 Tax=Wenxinia saemankumensis TaxID=1447782 RepID=A0A1M6ATP3_9RHOB|nr:DUF1289 domain-containing protein [Wenxinia saemankumensis]SHI39889.1 hypothetical protein SAMN05444417_0620 [Wenxinia saemankumensis]
MNDAVWTRPEPQSPCVKICVIHPQSRLCTGCKRTIDEIAAWGRMDAAARQAVLDDLPNRVVATRRGGRAGRLRD